MDVYHLQSSGGLSATSFMCIMKQEHKGNNKLLLQAEGPIKVLLPKAASGADA